MLSIPTPTSFTYCTVPTRTHSDTPWGVCTSVLRSGLLSRLQAATDLCALASCRMLCHGRAPEAVPAGHRGMRFAKKTTATDTRRRHPMFDLDAELRVPAQSLKLQAQRAQVLAAN